MRFIYEVKSYCDAGVYSYPDGQRFFYADEGQAIQATKRWGQELAGKTNSTIAIGCWTDEVFVLQCAKRGTMLVAMTRHPVL